MSYLDSAEILIGFLMVVIPVAVILFMSFFTVYLLFFAGLAITGVQAPSSIYTNGGTGTKFNFNRTWPGGAIYE